MNKNSEKYIEKEIRDYLIKGSEHFSSAIPGSIQGPPKKASGIDLRNSNMEGNSKRKEVRNLGDFMKNPLSDKNNWKDQITARKTFDEIKKVNMRNNPNWTKDYKNNTYSGINKNIQSNLNQIVKNLSKNYNQSAILYNKQSDIINRHQDLVESNTRKLDKQLDNLDKIQEQIMIKSRLIELNEEMESKKRMNKELIVGFFVIIPLLIIPGLLMAGQIVNSYSGIIVIFLIIIGYIIYFCVIYRKYNMRVYKLLDDGKDSMKGSITKFFEQERDRMRAEMGKNNNCICEEEEKRNDDFDEYMNLMPVNMTLSQYQNLFRKIGCVRDLNDKDCEKWRKMTSVLEVINNMKNNFKLASSCNGTDEENNFCFPGRCKKNNRLLNVNGPYKYNDGSGMDEQIYPLPVGGLDVEVDEKLYNFPLEMDKLRKLENPFMRMVFEMWLRNLKERGIEMNDTRLKSKLNLFDLEISENSPEPYWKDLHLPLIDNMDSNIKTVCQKYNSQRKDLGDGPGKFLTDTWHFFYQESMPGSIYEKWLFHIR